MTPRKPSPATKQDLHALENRLMKRFDKDIRSEIVVSEARLTAHFDRAIDKVITTSQQEILRHFDLTVETIRHDLAGASADEIASLTDRMHRLEHHVGLAPA